MAPRSQADLIRRKRRQKLSKTDPAGKSKKGKGTKPEQALIKRRRPSRRTIVARQVIAAAKTDKPEPSLCLQHIRVRKALMKMTGEARIAPDSVDLCSLGTMQVIGMLCDNIAILLAFSKKRKATVDMVKMALWITAKDLSVVGVDLMHEPGLVHKHALHAIVPRHGRSDTQTLWEQENDRLRTMELEREMDEALEG